MENIKLIKDELNIKLKDDTVELYSLAVGISNILNKLSKKYINNDSSLIKELNKYLDEMIKFNGSNEGLEYLLKIKSLSNLEVL